MEEEVDLPVLTAASAMAVIDLFVEEKELCEHGTYGAGFLALVKAARDHIASRA